MTSVDEILEKEDIQEYNKDIRTMTKREIRKYFRFKSSRKVNLVKLFKNLIWQSYQRISEGKLPPVDGNLRTYWYVYVKVLLSRLGYDVENPKYCDKLNKVFTELIVKHRLFRYVDFGFVDTLLRRYVGKQNGHLVLFVEKKGRYPHTLQIAKKYDATAISSDGFPNHIDIEFFIREMAEKGTLRDQIHIFGMVDYDPSGYWILNEFKQQLLDYGVEIGSVHSLVKPELFDNLEYAQYKLGKDRRLKNWMEITNGLNGEPYGIEIDALGGLGGGPTMKQLFEQSIQPYLATEAGIAAAPQAISEAKASWLAWLNQEPFFEAKEYNNRPL